MLIIVCCSCSSKHDDAFTLEPFKSSFELVGESILDNELGRQIEVAQDYIFVEQESGDISRELYHVYDANSFLFLGNVGNRGQGPNEFIGAQYSGQFEKIAGDVIIWVNDAPQYRIRAINLTKSLSSGEIELYREIRHHPQYNFQAILFVVNESDLAGFQPGFIPGTNLTPLNILKGSNLENFGEYPRVGNLSEVPDGERIIRNLNYISLGMRPDQSQFVVAMHHYDRLDIYDNKGELMSSKRHPNLYKEYDALSIVDPEKGLKNVMGFYKSIDVTNDYIFAVYQKKTMDEMISDAPSTTEVRVFDWQGNPKILLKCKENLSSIAVDIVRGQLYGYDSDKERFVRYDISEIIK